MNEITKDEAQRPKTKDRIVWLVFGFAIIFVYFFALGSIPLLGPDESRYAQVAREMFERGDWVTPTLGGFNWFEKPALLYWLQIVSYKIFGVSEFAARFGSAICGLLTVFSLWILEKFFTAETQRRREKETKDKGQRTKTELPNWLFLISASSIGLLTFSRGASFDIILTFPITAALVSFFIFDQSTKKSLATYHLSLTAFYFFIGVALIAKGLVGIVFPFAIVGSYYVLSRKLPSKTFVFSLFWGTLLSLSIAAIWYVPMYLQNGWMFIDEFFIQHQFQRYTSNKFQHPQPFWFFFIVLPLMTIPWLPFFLSSIYKAFSRQLSAVRKSVELTTYHLPLTTFALAWLVVPLLFFSFSGSKLPGYILPALPAALVLTAESAACFVENNRGRKIALQIVAALTFAFVVAALQFYVNDYARAETVKTLIETADSQGFQSEKILNFNTISHNAEFYGARRLVRTADGKQKQFFSAGEIVEEIKCRNMPDALVLSPLEYLNQLTENDAVEAKVLGDNGETAIVLVKVR